MRTRLLTLTLVLCLFFGFCAPAADATDGTVDIEVIVNDTIIAMDAPVQLVGDSTYVSYWPIVRALYPDAEAVWDAGQAVVTARGLHMIIHPALNYLEANGRYLYIPNGVLSLDSYLYIPSRVLAAALGTGIAWDPMGGNVVFTAGNGPIASGDTVYAEEDVYWLSRIIYAESGNQSLEGKIAVGNVVLNRVASSKFPNTVYDVIFQRNQFTPASGGTLDREPNAESVVAAKLCLDGANTAGNAMYFVNPVVSPNSWAARNRPYVTTIGEHASFG